MGEQKLASVVVITLVVGLVVGASVGAVLSTSDDGAAPGLAPQATDGDANRSTDSTDDPSGDAAVVRFENQTAFEQYVRRGQTQTGTYLMSAGRRVVADVARSEALEASDGGDAGTAEPTAAEAPKSSATGSSDGTDRRHSSTNVQEEGIDEPDVLKTNGREIYYAPPSHRVFDDRIAADHTADRGGQTHVISAATPASPTVIDGIDASGQLLLDGDRLVVIQRDRLIGYDVSDPGSPAQTWSQSLDSSVVTARQQGETLVLVTKTSVGPSDPCPIEPLGGAATVRCTDVYHPRSQVAVDVTYSAFAIDTASGSVDRSVSFVGSADNSVVYMSRDGLYVTYTDRSDRADLLIDGVLETSSDELPDWVTTRLREIQSYNLSTRATQIETQAVLRQWQSTLPASERKRVRAQLDENLREYVQEHKRALTSTGIVAIDTADFDVETVGTVPGTPLNQFSMDAANGTLRIATTIPGAYGTESVNDLYVLDASDLSIRGAARDMGRDQRIYAVRYVDETAYVVTYRRVDPFHVVDLSDPDDPTEVGKLKLPGFSSYLHPLEETHVLGIGKVDGEVKAVTFDVSDPSNPTITDDFVLSERWSAISQTHHAFLQDPRHEVFFLPGREGGYVMGYAEGRLSLEHVVDTPGAAQRALYVGDYLYVFGSQSVTVLNETSWTQTARLDFEA